MILTKRNNIFTKQVLVEKYEEIYAHSIRIVNVEEEINELQELKNVMVGTLYPSIVSEQIRELEKERNELHHLIKKAYDKFMYEQKNK